MHQRDGERRRTQPDGPTTGEGFVLLQPEVAGGLGERTVMDTTVTPPPSSACASG